VLNAELATQMGKRIDTLGTQFNIPMETSEESQRVTDWLSDYVPKTNHKHRPDHRRPHQTNH